MDGTEFRIRRALRDYFSNFGELVSFRWIFIPYNCQQDMIPDRIILHTVQWDAPYYFHNVWNRVMPGDVVLRGQCIFNSFCTAV
jgi:hypothetical protein